MLKDKFLVRLMTWENNNNNDAYPTVIKSFKSDNISELLDLFFKAKRHNILIEVPVETDNNFSKYDGCSCFIDDIKIIFGGEESLPCLDIYVNNIL